eukprot:s3386_g5.t1
MAGLPTTAELAALTSIEAVRLYCGCSQALWAVIDTALGGVASVILFSMLPAVTLRHTLHSVRITGDVTERSLTPMEVIQVAYMWRVARTCMELPDIDPLAEPAPQVTTATSSSPIKKVKASSVLDQMDDTEVAAMSRVELNEAYANHVEETGAEPQHDCDPTVEQIAAMRDRVITRQEAPYADFSILTPFGKTMQRQLKTRSWMIQQDGTFRALEVPGPPSFEAWKSCWRVFRSILFMLRYPASAPGMTPKKVITSAALEEYYDRIVKLSTDFPETWHLIMRAEDKCRSEMMERYRRQLTKAALEGRLPMNLDYDGTQPWIGVFTYAARNSEYWDEHVIKPSTIFIARGGRHMTSDKAERVNIPEPALEALNNVAKFAQHSDLSAPSKIKSPGKPGKGPKRAAVPEELSDSPPPPQKPKKKKETEHPRKWGNQYVTTADGVEICFKNAKGKVGSCPEPCADRRAHVCQFCLGNHNNASCPNKKTSKSGKGGGKRN